MQELLFQNYVLYPIFQIHHISTSNRIWICCCSKFTQFAAVANLSHQSMIWRFQFTARISTISHNVRSWPFTSDQTVQNRYSVQLRVIFTAGNLHPCWNVFPSFHWTIHMNMKTKIRSQQMEDDWVPFKHMFEVWLLWSTKTGYDIYTDAAHNLRKLHSPM